MNFTLHQLYVFGMVAKKRSITKASKELHMTQPAVSIQIKQLQDAVDLPIIEVVGRKLYLTEAGEYLYQTFQNVDRELESFDAAVSQLKGGLKGRLTISAASTAKYFLPYLLGEFKRRYPKVDILLKVTNRDEVLHHLAKNEYDLSILTQIPDDESIEAVPFLENPLVMCAPPQHRLVGKKNIAIRDLKNEPFIYRELGSGTRMVMEAYLKKHDIRIKPSMELGTNEAVKQAIMAGIGISLISRLSLQNDLPNNRIAILDLQHFPIMTHWHAIFKKEKKQIPVTSNFLSFLEEENINKYLP
ncbi:MAG TPA: LysR family transcriptional regulator [Balneolales bacterium]|nr:LysR family transcriptional regulator [Balneolales bacterium]